MSITFIGLLGYAGWTLLLLLVMEVMRTWLVLRGRHSASGFSIDGSDVSPFAARLARAHANCYESFPIIGGLMLLALATGLTSVTDPLALWVLAARVGQSSIHLVSVSDRAVTLRFALFAVQLVIACWWTIRMTLVWLGG